MCGTPVCLVHLNSSAFEAMVRKHSLVLGHYCGDLGTLAVQLRHLVACHSGVSSVVCCNILGCTGYWP